MEYKLVAGTDSDTDSFNERVNEALADGWELYWRAARVCILRKRNRRHSIRACGSPYSSSREARLTLPLPPTFLGRPPTSWA